MFSALRARISFSVTLSACNGTPCVVADGNTNGLSPAAARASTKKLFRERRQRHHMQVVLVLVSRVRNVSNT